MGRGLLQFAGQRLHRIVNLLFLEEPPHRPLPVGQAVGHRLHRGQDLLDLRPRGPQVSDRLGEAGGGDPADLLPGPVVGVGRLAPGDLHPLPAHDPDVADLEAGALRDPGPLAEGEADPDLLFLQDQVRDVADLHPAHRHLVVHLQPAHGVEDDVQGVILLEDADVAQDHGEENEQGDPDEEDRADPHFGGKSHCSASVISPYSFSGSPWMNCWTRGLRLA